jgi:hypothetical protein
MLTELAVIRPCALGSQKLTRLQSGPIRAVSGILGNYAS